MSCKNIIMQGDQCDLTFSLTVDNEELDIDTITKIQFKVGNLFKTYIKDDNESEVTYNSEDKLFYFPLTEEETFALDNTNVNVEIRVKFTDDKIKGLALGSISLQFSEITELMDEPIEETQSEENENENNS